MDRTRNMRPWEYKVTTSLFHMVMKCSAEGFYAAEPEKSWRYLLATCRGGVGVKVRINGIDPTSCSLHVLFLTQ